MRFLFTTLPGTGHLLPLVPVARGLRHRGHDVAFASSSAFAPAIAAAGFRSHPVGRAWLTAEMGRRFPALADIPPGPDRYSWARRNIFAREAALDVVPDLVRVATEWRPDVIVREAAEYGGYIAAEVLGIPHAMVRTDSGSSSFADRKHVAAELDEVRARHGLTPDALGDGPFRSLQLSFAPPGLDEEPTAPTCVQLRPPPPDHETPTPRWPKTMHRCHDRIVYATLGTVYNSEEALATIVEAFADGPLGLVLTTGRGTPWTAPVPANVRIEPWIPQDAVLPHCAAVVTHGGYGTASAALGHGLPMVLVPISADQPLNSQRLSAAGVGLTLAAADRSAAAIRAAIETVLTDPSYRQTAQRLAAAARQRPGLDHGLDLLELLPPQAR